MKRLQTFFPVVLCFFVYSCAYVKGQERVRFATMNIAMGLPDSGALLVRLEAGNNPDLANFAAIVQMVRPDILLVNEFDYHPQASQLLIQNYLSVPQGDLAAIDYPYSWSAPVNTGVVSGLDLDGDGVPGGPGDAWGYGMYPGQYGMLVLSRFPIEESEIRTFRHFLWKDMPEAERPVDESGDSFYSDEVWDQLRLSSKSHWDIPVKVNGKFIHVLASHPTPPVFDGPEDRNGRRNYDEIRLWADYIEPERSYYLYDDNGKRGGLEAGGAFIIAGDQNSDPQDGDSFKQSIQQLTRHPRVNNNCVPSSSGAVEASTVQAGSNLGQSGNPAFDTADFYDGSTGNLRIDYALPSEKLDVRTCGVFWPAENEPGHELIHFSDHRMVWIDLDL